MKRKIYILLISAFLLNRVSAQNVGTFRSVELRYGRTGLTGDIFKVLHERYFAEKVNITFCGAVELSRKNLNNYRCFSLDVVGEYYTGLGYKTNDDFQAKVGVGVTANYSTENSLLKDMTPMQRVNYGVLFQAVGEWAFTDDLSLTASAVQRLYKKKSLGMFQYEYCLGIKLKLF